MRRNILLKTLAISIFFFLSCETEPVEFIDEVLESSEQPEEQESTDENESDNDEQSGSETGNSEFAMTAMINDISFEANNPFGTNEFSDTNIFNFYPIEDFVLLQAREGGLLGQKEINLWLKREDIVVGSYQVTYEFLGLTPPTHYIDLVDNTNSIDEQTKEGTISILEVDETLKIVKGTFEFTTVNDDEFAPVDFTVTNGTFNYKYE